MLLVQLNLINVSPPDLNFARSPPCPSVGRAASLASVGEGREHRDGIVKGQYGGGRRTRCFAPLRNRSLVTRASRSLSAAACDLKIRKTSASCATPSPIAVPAVDQTICRRVESSIASGRKDATGVTYADGSVTNGEEHLTRDMSAIKASGTPGSARVLPTFRYEHFVAGISGGAVSTLMLHPLDLIKIRFAVNDGQTNNVSPRYNGLRSAVTEIVKSEGLRGLYRGVTPNVLGSGSSWGLYFFFYNTAKTWIQKGDSKKQLGPMMHMLAAANAGTLSLILTNPIWVVKTRLCLQYAADKEVLSESKRYHGMVDALKKIYRTEGIRGLYKGFVPGMFGVSHGAIQFMTYEQMKDRYNNYMNVPIDTKLGAAEYIVFAAISKFIAAGTTYPYQVVRARLQDLHHDYKGAWDCIQLTWRYEGWRGFYKGLSANLTRVVPATVITFVVYEKVSQNLQERRPIDAVRQAQLAMLVQEDAES